MEAHSINPITEDCLLEALDCDRQADALAANGLYVLAEERRERAERLRAKAYYHEAPEDV